MRFHVSVVGRRLVTSSRLAILGVATVGLLGLSSCTSTSAYGPVVPQPVTVEQIVKMSKAGIAPDEIVRRMRESRTVYRLSASQLAELRDKGVADPVIDYMQHTYLAAVRRSAKLENWSYWHRWSDGFWYGGEAFGWPYYWYWPDDDFFFGEVGPIERGGHDGHEGHGEHH
jgi:hypothetical protein